MKDRRTYKLAEFLTGCTPFEMIERVMAKKDYQRFVKWMDGQTVSEFGVYNHDLVRFLNYHNQGKRLKDMKVYD